jgi:circadian clock protein KaiC
MKRLETGVPELDLVLDGGLPLGSLVVFAGGPGTGKTTLAQQISFTAATPEHKAIYYTTLAEPHNKLVRYMEGFEFFDATALEERVEFINLGDLLIEEGDRNSDPLGPMITEIVRTCFERKPCVVVIDSAKALRDFVDEGALRRVIYDLAGKVAHSDTVVLFLGEYADEEIEGSPESSIADGIVQFAYEPREPVDRRWLRVRKLRGAHHLAGKHSFEIGRAGITVYPRLETIAIAPGDEPRAGKRISSGIARLDELMGGGSQVGDATAILGPSGSGKTIACVHFVVQGLEEGERCLFVSFQETPSQLMEKAASFGLDLAGACESGQLTIYHVSPGDLDLDTIGAAVRAELADDSLRRVAIDSLGELVFASRETERFPAFARALTGSIRAGGASSLITSETTMLGPTAEPLAHLSFLFHNVILVRYIEIESESRRAISILKMRDSNHAKGIWEFAIDEHGFAIGDKLEGLTGLLGWTALRDEPPSIGLVS